MLEDATHTGQLEERIAGALISAVQAEDSEVAKHLVMAIQSLDTPMDGLSSTTVAVLGDYLFEICDDPSVAESMADGGASSSKTYLARKVRRSLRSLIGVSEAIAKGVPGVIEARTDILELVSEGQEEAAAELIDTIITPLGPEQMASLLRAGSRQTLHPAPRGDMGFRTEHLP